LAEVLEQLDNIMLTLSTLKADHLLSHLITASYFVTCTQMLYHGSDSPNIVHLQPQGGRGKSIERRWNLEQPKQVAGPATDVALRDLLIPNFPQSGRRVLSDPNPQAPIPRCMGRCVGTIVNKTVQLMINQQS
jgi:hypothetical protein